LEKIDDPVVPVSSFTVTNKGIEINTCLGLGQSPKDYLLNLKCTNSSIALDNEQDHTLVVRLVKTTTGFARHRANTQSLVDQNSISFRDLVPVYIPKVINDAESLKLRARLEHSFSIRVCPNETRVEYRIISYVPDCLYDSQAQRFLSAGHGRFIGLVEIEFTFIGIRQRCVAVFGLISDYGKRPGTSQPWFALLADEDGGPNELLRLAQDGLVDQNALSRLGHRFRSMCRTSKRSSLPTTVTLNVPFPERPRVALVNIWYHQVQVDGFQAYTLIVGADVNTSLMPIESVS
jgi:hypothetical protein